MTTSLAGKRVAVYARYSSTLQSETSIEDQVTRCAAFVDAAGGVVSDDLIFTDIAISAASLQRPGFARMMAAVEEHRVDAIVTEDLSRISRDIADSAALFKKLQYLSVPLIGVADGIHTGEKSAKLTFWAKSFVADLYLDDLRDKTLRGLKARAQNGYSTGGLPFGYRSMPDVGADGRVRGHIIEVDAEAAAIVRRVFALYVSGLSYAGIAKMFNAEGVPYARLRTKHRRKGWVAGSTRAIIHNSSYIGDWAYGRRQWVKLPGTNVRRPRRRPEAEVIRRHFPERRIIEPEVWNAAQQRAAAVHARYTNKRAARSAPGVKTPYPFSGLLLCGSCGAPMVVSGGSSANYYNCGDHKKRGTCPNRLSVREDLVRRRMFAAIRERVATPAAIEYLRRRVAERLGALVREAGREIEERRARLARTEARIGGLVQFIADGDQSQYIRETLLDLEAQARAEKTGIEVAGMRARMPARLPAPEEILNRALALETLLAADPVRAREALRQLFREGRIVLDPTDEGVYEARAELLPLVVVGEGLVADDDFSVTMVVRLA
ncbi:MAG: recombinase family protein [Myxococcales bacterium]|nr:recombinase family protein [Myxococcales bacterium]